MKIGIVSDSLAHLSFSSMLDTAARLGIEGIEINTGNWSSAPHLELAAMLTKPSAQRDFLKAFADRGLKLIGFNANGNQLHPTDGQRQSKIVNDTIRLAGILGVTKICLMSGLPAGGPNDRMPNWVVSSWPPETQTMLKWQWEENLLPYWRKPQLWLLKMASNNSASNCTATNWSIMFPHFSGFVGKSDLRLVPISIQVI